MNRDHHRWYSPNLGRDMELLVYGYSGARVIVFPTSQGRYFDWESQGMVEAMAEPIERGEVQLYAVDSVDAESWYARWKWPGDRAWRQTQYDAYIAREVIPFTQRNSNPFLIVMGASFGAYQAVNFAFRHPDMVGRVLAMNGLYDISDWTDGHHDDNVYFNNPVEFVKNEHDEGRLTQMRAMDIIITTSETEPLRGATEYFSQILWQKNIWHALRIWNGWAHDWPYWKQMINLYLSGAN